MACVGKTLKASERERKDPTIYKGIYMEIRNLVTRVKRAG
jgi:hypothetical protein